MLRYIGITVVLVALGIIAVLLLRPQTSSEILADSTFNTTTVQRELAVSVNGMNVSEIGISKPPAQLRNQPPSAIRASQIARIKTVGSQKVIVFTDNSELLVSDYVYEQLPGDIQLKVGYER